jgi:hypothetical protein
MKKLTIATLVLLAAITNMALASQKRKVLIIGIDGVRSDALQTANTPNIDALIASGFYTYDSWHCGITVSGPSWSTIFTGVWFPKHGVTDNSYAGSHFDAYPYYAKRVKEIKPSLYATQVVDWAPMSTKVTNDGYDVKVVRTENDCAAVAAAAQTQLLNPNLDAFTLYFAKVDNIGHSSGFSPANPAYMAAIHEVDSFIGRVMTTLKSRPTYTSEDWLVLITTDHGGNGTSHGGNADVERHIWWIASGTGIISRQVLASDPGSYNMSANPVIPSKLILAPVQADIAVTAMHHLMYDASDLSLRPENQAAWKLDGKSWLDSMKRSTPPGTGIQDADPAFATGVKIYPNPSTGLFTFWFDAQNQPVAYMVFNEAGQIVKSESGLNIDSKLNIDLADQYNGAYFIRLQCGSQVMTRKVILNK